MAEEWREATPEYTAAVFKEALTWKWDGGECPPRRPPVEARCLSCGELAYRLWNGARRCYEFLCLAPLEACGAHYRLKDGTPERLDRPQPEGAESAHERCPF